MKLKMTADSKSWLVFGGFCIILLFFVAIVELNFIQLAKGDLDHPFWGLNPFPAFTSGYLHITIPLYLVAVGASLFSVKDKFFTMEKGIGFSTQPKYDSKGYSKWLSDKDLKKELKMVRVQDEKAVAGGLPLINDGKKMWVDDSGSHTLIIGSTGAGKTQVAIFPLVHSLAKHDESMIITDPKGEIYEETANMLKKRGYNVIVLNFRDPLHGSGWNPMHLPYKYYKAGNTDKANELTDDLAANILYDEGGQGSDPFWQNTSANYFSGICLGLFDDAKEDELNLNTINLFTTVGEEKVPGTKNLYANEYFKLTKEPTSPAYVSASSTISAPSDTRGSIISVFQQKIRLFASRDNLSEMLSHSDFEFEDIGKKKTAVFIVIQDEKKTYHSLVTIFLKQCYEALVDYAQKSGGKLPYRTNFLLDEFANMPELKDVDAMVSAARSRNMRFFFVIQNFAQLSKVYGKEKGDTIRGNCTNTVYLISSELTALEEISKMCGEVKVKTDKKDKDGNAVEETRPLITISDLQKLKMGEIILLSLRRNPFRTKLKLNWQIDWGKYDTCEKAGYPTRERQPIHVFDLKSFVDKKREEKMNNLVNQFSQSTFGPMEPKGVNSDLKADFFRSLNQKIAEEDKIVTDQVQNFAKINPIKMEALKPREEVKEVNNAVPSFINTSDSVKPDLFKKEDTSKFVSTPLKKEEVSKNEMPFKSIFKNAKEANFDKDFASKITASVNKKAIEDNKKVTDDQFFDDFFTDDDN